MSKLKLAGAFLLFAQSALANGSAVGSDVGSCADPAPSMPYLLERPVQQKNLARPTAEALKTLAARVRTGASPADQARLRELAAAAKPTAFVDADLERNVGRAPASHAVSTPSGPESAGDVFIFTPHSGIWSSPRRIANPSGASDYYANRFVTSQLARQLPFEIDAAWMLIDNAYAWSRNWQLSVVPESSTTPYFPEFSTILTSGTVDAQAYFPQVARGGPVNDLNVRAQMPNVPYPAAGVLAINDLSHDDTFNRADGPIHAQASGAQWIECSGTACFPAAPTLLVTGNRLRASAAGTNIAWRLPGREVAPTTPDPLRYFYDYIEDSAALFFNPDNDVRMDLSYDLSAGSATRAGVFARGTFDGANIINYYAIYVDAGAGVVSIADSNNFAAPLMSSAPGVPATGILRVEVTGFSPVTFNVYVDGNPVLTFQDTNAMRLYRGDVGFGNIFGVAFPNAGGGEIIDGFVVRRNADLFVVAKMPAGEDVFIWGDGDETGREFFNTFTSTTGTTWAQTGVCTGATNIDCVKIRNTMVALQVTEPVGLPVGQHSLYQLNNTFTTLRLPCCTCTSKVYTCGCANALLDPCGSPFDTRPMYDVNQAIDIVPVFANERSPNVPPTDLDADPNNNRTWIFWIACPTGTFGTAACGLSSCDQTPGTGNCGVYAFALGDNPCATGIPGLNTGAVTDQFGAAGCGPDGFIDGALSLSPSVPHQWTPTAAGIYDVILLEFYDTDANSTSDPFLIDEYLSNRFVIRTIEIEGACVDVADNYSVNSLWLLKTSSSCGAAETYGTWTRTMPLADTYNLHEHTDRATYVADRMANPYPQPAANVPLIAGGAPPNFCFTSAATTPGSISYYTMWQANCDGSSRQDP